MNESVEHPRFGEGVQTRQLSSLLKARLWLDGACRDRMLDHSEIIT